MFFFCCQSTQPKFISWSFFSFFILDLNIFNRLNDSERFNSVGMVCQICGPLYTIESIILFTANLVSY